MDGRDAVAAVAVAVVDPSPGQRPEERPVVIADVDRAAPGVLDPDVGQAREQAAEALGRASAPSRHRG